MKLPVTLTHEHLNERRKQLGKKSISEHTVVDYYYLCREVAEVIASNQPNLLGGEGKTIELDETFITKRKYNRGRVTKTMTQTVFFFFPGNEVFFLIGRLLKTTDVREADVLYNVC